MTSPRLTWWTPRVSTRGEGRTLAGVDRVLLTKRLDVDFCRVFAMRCRPA